MAFEQYFQKFVTQIRGELLPEGDGPTADYLFREFNVIAELKVLEEDARLKHHAKVQKAYNDWRRRGLVRGWGTFMIDMQSLPAICQKEWLEILREPVEEIVRSANRQIRCTKEKLQLPDARGILLIANTGNKLHNGNATFPIVLSNVLSKKTPQGELQFPHIDGVVFFSAPIEQANYWRAMDAHPLGDAQTREFLKMLMPKWMEYVSKTTRLPVTVLRMPAA